jgi:hypothetical protein
MNVTRSKVVTHPPHERKERSETRAILLTTTIALALSSGVALAATITCTGGFCQGTGARDTIYGSDIDDEIRAGGNNDSVYGNGGNDDLSGESGNDRLYGRAGNDQLREQGSSDVAGGYDRFVGGGGNDDIIPLDPFSGNPYVDTVSAGSGDDFVGAVDFSEDRIECGAGVDTVEFDSSVDTVADDCEVQRPF